jgi:adenine/guanine phosphoribosyltransferase-like PRPP-binding protein
MNLKRITNNVFLLLSVSLSVYFLWFNCDEVIGKSITTMCAVFFEVGMKYNLSYSRSLFKVGWKLGWKGMHLILGSLILFAFYGGYMIYNIATMAGFFISATVKQDQAVVQAEALENQKMIQLRQLNEEIDTLIKALDKEVETTYRSKSEELNQKIEKKKAEREKLINRMNLYEEKIIEKNPSRAVAEALGIPLGTMLAYIYGFFAAGICLILIITSEDLPEKKREEVNILTKNVLDIKQDLLKYIDAVIRDTGKLNSNQKVMEMTGLPLDQCIKFREWLRNLKIDGIPAVSISVGGGEVNIPKNKLLKLIKGVS